MRIRALSKLVSYTNIDMSKKLANGLFMRKLSYGIQTCGSAPDYLLKKLQVSQNNAARVTLGFRPLRINQTSLMKNMGWLQVKDLVKFHSAKTIHQAVTTGKPEYISMRLTGYRSNEDQATRSMSNGKLGPRPRAIGATGLSKYTFIAKAFELYNSIPSIITAIQGPKMFSRRLKMFLVNHDNVPSIHDKGFRSLLDPETAQRLLGEDQLQPHRRQRRQSQQAPLNHDDD
jgi:hypothetical protein